MKNFFFVLLIWSLFSLFFLQCSDSNSISPQNNYPEATAQNIDVSQIEKAIENLSQIKGIKSIVLGRNGKIAAEEYFNDAGNDVIHDVRSVTKSVMALLIGIAIRDGFIQSVDQTVGEFFIGKVVDFLDPAKAKITIEQLLNMSCGLEWHELDGGNSYMDWYRSGDHVSWVLNQPPIHEPGDGFNYNTGSIHLLSVILKITTGMNALDFAQNYLFEPMGIQYSDWTTITSNGKSYNNGGAGLKISPHTMFAIGNLMLNSGKLNNVQVVPEEWSNKCISIQNETSYSNPISSHYGYLWWVGKVHGHDHYYASGWGGQFIVCVPDFNFVIVATCEWKGISDEQANQNWYGIFDIIIADILTAVKE